MQTNIDMENLEVTFSVASTTPCRRLDDDGKIFFETLKISEDAVNLSRLNDGASILKNHDSDQILGTTLRAWIDGDKLMVHARFRKNDPDAVAVFNDIADGTLKNVSIGYIPEKFSEKKENGVRVLDVTYWTAFEVSVAVGIPADPTVGFYRSLIPTKKRNQNMEEDKKTQCQGCPYQQKNDDGKTPPPNPDDQLNKKNNDPEGNPPEGNPEGNPDDKLKDKIRSLAIPKKRGFMKKENYDLTRAFQSLVNPDVNVSAERAVSDQLFRSAGLAPSRSWLMLATRDADLTGAADSGDGFIGTDHRGDLFVRSLLTRMGVKNPTVLSGLQGNVEIPAQTASAVVGVGKLGSTSPKAKPAVGSITLSPKKFSASVTVGEDLLAQGNPDTIAFVIDELSAQIARKLDYSILKGCDDPAISGVDKDSKVQSQIITDLSAITWQDVMAMYGKIADYEIEDGDLAWVTKGLTKANLMATSKDAGSGRFLCEENKMAGYDVNICGALSADDLYLGVWKNVIVGQWGGLQVKIDDITGIREGSVTIVAKLLADIAITNPASFVKRVKS